MCVRPVCFVSARPAGPVADGDAGLQESMRVSVQRHSRARSLQDGRMESFLTVNTSAAQAKGFNICLYIRRLTFTVYLLESTPLSHCLHIVFCTSLSLSFPLGVSKGWLGSERQGCNLEETLNPNRDANTRLCAPPCHHASATCWSLRLDGQPGTRRPACLSHFASN